MRVAEFIKENWIFFFILFGIFYFLFIVPRSGDTIIKTCHFIMIILILGYFAADGFIEKCKYHSKQLCGTDYHTSLGDTPYPFLDGNVEFYLFRNEGYQAYGLSQSGKGGCTVIPQDFVREMSGNYTSHALHVKVNVNELPQAAREYIKEHKLEAPYYLDLLPLTLTGEVNTDLTNASVKLFNDKLAVLYRQGNYINSEQQELLSNKLDNYDKYTESVSNTVHSVNKPVTFINKVGNAINNIGENEE